MAEIAVRFALGGIIVSAFAAIGEICQPKTFAGIFSAAPSVALASLALAFAKHGTPYVAAQCLALPMGAFGLALYCGACAAVVRRNEIPVWFGAGACWAVWLVASLGLWWLLRWGGGIL